MNLAPRAWLPSQGKFRPKWAHFSLASWTANDFSARPLWVVMVKSLAFLSSGDSSFYLQPNRIDNLPLRLHNNFHFCQCLDGNVSSYDAPLTWLSLVTMLLPLAAPYNTRHAWRVWTFVEMVLGLRGPRAWQRASEAALVSLSSISAPTKLILLASRR